EDVAIERILHGCKLIERRQRPVVELGVGVKSAPRKPGQQKKQERDRCRSRRRSHCAAGVTGAPRYVPVSVRRKATSASTWSSERLRFSCAAPILRIASPRVEALPS